MHAIRTTLIAALAGGLLSPAFAADKVEVAPGAKKSDLANAALAPALPPLIILAPTEVRTDPTLARGCWVRLFPQKAFKGKDDLTVAGPLELAQLHTPVGVDWKHKSQSMIVGPKAKVTLYEGEHFADKNASFKPGAQVEDLHREAPFKRAINSMKIACEK